MSHQLRDHLRPVRRRQQWHLLLRSVSCGLLVGGIGACLLSIAHLMGLPVALSWVLGTVAVGAGLGTVVGLLRGWSWHAAAAAVDACYSLKDRVVSALAFSDHPAQAAANATVRELQIADALEQLQRVDPRQAAPFSIPRLLPTALLVVAVALGLLLIPGGDRTVAARPTVSLPHIQSEAEYLEETMMEELRALLDDEEMVEPEFKELVAQLDELVEELAQEGVDVKQALAKLSEMQMAIAGLMSQYDSEVVDANMKSLGEALSGAQATMSASEALANGAYSQAADSLEQVDPSQLTRQEADSVGDKLQDLSKRLSDSKMSDAASQVAAGLAKGNEGQSREGMRQLASLARSQALRQSISQSLGNQLARLGECKGNCVGGANPGSQNGGAKVALSESPSLNWGSGAAESAFGEQATDLDSRRDLMEITGMHGAGPSEKETLASPEAREQARRAYREQYQEYRKLAEAVTASEALPLGHRQIIRTYFEAIRPTNAETEEVMPTDAP